MHRPLVRVKSVSTVSILVMVLAGCSEPRRESGPSSAPGFSGEETPEVDDGDPKPARLEILYPPDEALFPPDVVAPTFRWKDGTPDSDAWRIAFQFSDGGRALEFRSRQTEWTVPDESWEDIKKRSRGQEAQVTISGARGAAPEEDVSRASVRISTSEDEVGAPLFFREVNLPFAMAVKDPAAYIRWRFGPISCKRPPPIVLEKLPVCGNCHSFSADGAVVGMDVDYANNKASYAICPVEREMILDQGKLIAWSDYRREDREETFGLLSQISPNGRYVVSTVKDRSVFVATDDLAFSQLFFPVKGILVCYDRKTKGFRSLSGADDPRFVQSNPAWSPDGRYIVFARSKVHHLKNVRNRESALLTKKDCEEFLEEGKTFLFDLYRIPFNDGKGGEAVPLEGASNNGMSNYFPKFSPDGKWIVFCKAKSFMLLQPDSELYIIPAQGGRARRLRCNTSRMNSWHSWSPNGKWLVFSSKAYSDYTQLFLTHIDEQGRASVPVVLSRFTQPERAANIPEFVNLEPDAIQKISAAFVDDHNYYRAAFEFIRQGDPAGAVPLLQKSLEINPKNAGSRLELATILAADGKVEEAKAHLAKILELPPDELEIEDLAGAHHRLASILHREQRLEEAADHCRQAIRSDPSLYQAHASLGLILLDTGKPGESVEHLALALRLGPKDALANYAWGHFLHRQGKVDEAAAYYRRAVEHNPKFAQALLGLASIYLMVDRPELVNLDEALALAQRACDATGHRDPIALKTLAGAYAVAGRFGDAVNTARNALKIARAAGDQDLANGTQKMLDVYEKLDADNQK